MRNALIAQFAIAVERFLNGFGAAHPEIADLLFKSYDLRFKKTAKL